MPISARLSAGRLRTLGARGGYDRRRRCGLRDREETPLPRDALQGDDAAIDEVEFGAGDDISHRGGHEYLAGFGCAHDPGPV